MRHENWVQYYGQHTIQVGDRYRVEYSDGTAFESVFTHERDLEGIPQTAVVFYDKQSLIPKVGDTVSTEEEADMAAVGTIALSANNVTFEKTDEDTWGTTDFKYAYESPYSDYGIADTGVKVIFIKHVDNNLPF